MPRSPTRRPPRADSSGSARADRAPPPAPRTVRLPPAPDAAPDVLGLVAESWAARSLEHGLQEVGRDAAFRAGSQGLFLDDPRTGAHAVTAACHRAAYARYVGAEEPAREGDAREENKELMFSAGRGNEELFVADLASWTRKGGVILREEEIPIRAEIDGVPLTGRPDIVLARPRAGAEDAVQMADIAGERAPITSLVEVALGLELKLVCSVGTAVEVLFHGPKLPHLAQAGRYLAALSDAAGRSVPYQIWYTGNVVYPIPQWSFITKHIPERGEPGSEFVEYSPKKGEATKIPPFRIGYDLRFAEDPETGLARLYFRRVRPVAPLAYLSNGSTISHHAGMGSFDGQGQPVPYSTITPEGASRPTAVGGEAWTWTLVTREGLDDYWRMVRDVGDGHLGPRPKNLEFDGQPSWPKCNFCGFKPLCDAKEAQPLQWLADVNRQATERRAQLAAQEALLSEGEVALRKDTP